MVAFKAAEVESFMARPDPDKLIVLVFGPDAGLVRERVAALVRSCVDDPSDPFGFAILEVLRCGGACRGGAAGDRLSNHHRGG